jgi:hypothetical protein
MPLPQTAFQNKPAGRVTREVFEAIKELLPRGKLFGAWARQMEFAKKIEEYIKNRRILGGRVLSNKNMFC